MPGSGSPNVLPSRRNRSKGLLDTFFSNLSCLTIYLLILKLNLIEKGSLKSELIEKVLLRLKVFQHFFFSTN